MQLRWLVRKYPKPTVEEVKELYNEGGMSLSQCYNSLKKPDERILQILVHMNCPDRGLGNYWVDAPVVEEMVDE